jgi:hypothetical protein
MKIAGRYARQFSRQSFTPLRCVQAGIAGYPNVRARPSTRQNIIKIAFGEDERSLRESFIAYGEEVRSLTQIFFLLSGKYEKIQS